MTQTRKDSLAEAVSGFVVNFVVVLVWGGIIYPLFEHESGNWWLVARSSTFVIASVASGYAVRRMFNAIGKRDASQDLYASYLVGRHSARRQFAVNFTPDEHIGHNVAACWNCVHHADGRCTRSSIVVDPVHACFSFRNKHNGEDE